MGLAMLLLTLFLILLLPQPTMKIAPTYATERALLTRSLPKVIPEVLPPPKGTLPLDPLTQLEPKPHLTPLLVPDTIPPPKMMRIFLRGKELLMRRVFFPSGALMMVQRRIRRIHQSLVRMMMSLREMLVKPME